MDRKYNIYENDEYKFIEFSNILKDIRDSYLEDIYKYGPTKRREMTFLRHSTLIKILLSWKYIDINKTNAILITNDISIYSGDLLDDEDFLWKVKKIIDKAKRKIPLLIKNIDCSFKDLNEFLKTGEGKEFILQLDSDKEKLRNNTDAFKEFKIFARNNDLSYILSEIMNKKEFNRLFLG